MSDGENVNETVIIVGQGQSYYIRNKCDDECIDNLSKINDKFDEFLNMLYDMKNYCNNNGLFICDNLSVDTLINFSTQD